MIEQTCITFNKVPYSYIQPKDALPPHNPIPPKPPSTAMLPPRTARVLHIQALLPLRAFGDEHLAMIRVMLVREITIYHDGGIFDGGPPRLFPRIQALDNVELGLYVEEIPLARQDGVYFHHIVVLPSVIRCPV